LIYLIERYLVHEPILLWGVLFWRGIGPAVEFKSEGREWFPRATATFMWIRFGMRPQDSTELGERAESRFNTYMAIRMGAVHALGSTWIIGLVIFVVGMSNQSAFTDWQVQSWIVCPLFLIMVAAAWIWHTRMAALAEQYHYSSAP